MTCGVTHYACPCTLARLELLEELREGAAWLVEGVTDGEGLSLDAVAALARSLDALDRFDGEAA